MLIITSETTVTTQPTEGSLHDPTMWQDFEPFDIIRTFDDFQHPAELFANLLHDRSVSAIGPDQLQTTVAIVQTMFSALKQFLQSQETSCSILSACTMNQDQQHQSQNIHDQVPFSAWGLLMHIHTAFFTAFRRFDALAVNHSGTGLLLPSSFLAHLLDQNLIDLFPQSIVLPAPIIVVHRTPRRKIDRQHPPLATGAVNIQDRVDNLPFFPFLWTPKSGAGKKFRNQLPFGILQVSWVGLGECDHSPILPDYF